MTSLRLAALLVGCCFAMCSHHAPATHLSMRTPANLAYTRIAVALGERDPDSIDYYYGPEEQVADIRKSPPPLPEVRRSALALMNELQTAHLPGGDDQKQFLLAQLQAVASRVDLLLGAKPSFDQETKALFGVTVPPAADAPRLAYIRSQLNALLPGQGTLAERYLRFDRAFVVPPRRLPAVMNRALQGCRQQTTAHLQLPANESVTVEYLHDKPWSAFSRYQGNFHSLIQVNQDFDLTVDQVLQLACHEGYPGHHTYNSIQDQQLVRRERRSEFAVQPTFSPQSLASEAAATFAVDLAFPEPERTRFERDELFPLAGLAPYKVERYNRVERLVGALHPAEPAIARDYLDGKLEFERAASALEDQLLMVHSEATLKYINEYRTYMVAYTSGRDMMANLVDAQPGQRWQSFERFITAGRTL